MLQRPGKTHFINPQGDGSTFCAPSDAPLTDTSLERHDRYNFEVKLDYSLAKEQKISKYDISIYYFIPRALQVTEKTYPRAKFYADFTNYIRFRTPHMSIAGILNPNNKLSPLHHIRNCIIQFQNGEIDEKINQKIIYELRMLGAIYKSAVRDQIKFFLNEVCEVQEKTEIMSKIEAHLADITRFRETILDIGRDIAAPHIPPVVRDAFQFVDEYTSLQTQEQLTKAYKRLQNQLECKSVCGDLAQAIEREIIHRRSVKSHLVRNHKEENESFTYWEGILKKFIQGVLYLNIRDKDEESAALQIFYSFAAGIAMFVSLLLGMWISGFFEQSSLVLLLALSIAYIFKDRIKDNIRIWSNKAVGHIFPDRKIEIIDIDGAEKLGSLRETVRFVKPAEIPPEILKIRQASNISLVEQEGKPEKILRYSKRVRLYSKKIGQIHARHGDIFDIMRFNVKNFIQYADDPKRTEEVWNTETKTIEEVVCAKVYHLNLVFKLHARHIDGNEQITFKKVQVILDQNGIKAINEPTVKM
jgi:hypothetical protein